MCQAEGKTRRKGMMDGKAEREKERRVGERKELKKDRDTWSRNLLMHTTDSLIRVRSKEAENGIAYRFVVDDKGFALPYISCNQT